MLNLVSLSTQSLASCVNYFVWNCLPCFSNTNIGSVTSSFDIVQFSRSCAPQPCGWRLDYFTTEAVFCQALFWEAFELFRTWIVQQFLGANRNIWTFIGSFQGLPAGTSEVILLSQRLALTYSTIPQPLLQAFFTFFSPFFALCELSPVFRREPPGVLTSPAAAVSPALYYYII